MRICYVSDERFPSSHTDTQQMAMTMDALTAVGVEVELVAPRLLTGPHASDQPAALRKYYGVTRPFRVRLVKTVNPESRAAVKTLHPLPSMLAIRGQKPDLVYTRNAQIALVALSLGHRVAFESYRIIDRRAPRLVRLLSRATRSRRFLGVITHSEMSANAFRRSGVPNEKIQVIYNGFSTRQMEPRLDVAAARMAVGAGLDADIAVFAGHIMPNKGLESLARVAKRTPNVRHIWVGGDNDGSPDFGLRVCRDEGINNVSVTGWLSAAEVAPYLYAADVLLVPPSSTPLATHGNTVLPMKIFGYLAAGRSIIAPDLPDLRELLVHGSNAFLAPANDERAAAEAITKVMADTPLREKLAAGARDTASGLTWEARAAKIERFLGERLSASKRRSEET